MTTTAKSARVFSSRLIADQLCTDAGNGLDDEGQARDYGLDLGFSFGVGDGNPHYQLGNLYSPVLSHGLTCGAECPQMTVRDRSLPTLMARQWPGEP